MNQRDWMRKALNRKGKGCGTALGMALAGVLLTSWALLWVPAA